MAPRGSRIVGYVDQPEGAFGDADASRLRAAGVEAIWHEGDLDGRSVLCKLMGELDKGDVLMVVSMDRLGRPVRQLLRRVTSLHKRGVGLRCLEGNVRIDKSKTGSAQHCVISALMECYSNWERSAARDRARAMERRGTRPGAHPKLETVATEHLLAMLSERGASHIDVARRLGVGRTTLYRHLKRVIEHK